MARITTRDCERVVRNRYELALLAAELARELPCPSRFAREPNRRREAKAVIALRRIAEHAADPRSLRINLGRRMRGIPLPDQSNNNQPGDQAAGLA